MQQDKARDGVFISYARSDGKQFAEMLRLRLEGQKIKVWQDVEEIEGGYKWWLQIENALDKVAFMSLVITPNALKSEIVRKEWNYARQRGVCVYPIKGAPNLTLPRWMSKRHFYDLGTIENEFNGPDWRKFLADLNRTPDVPRAPFMAEDLLDDFTPRPGEFEQLIRLFLDEKGVEPLALNAALCGAGGYGKTTIAKAVCQDERIQNAFDDGVLWVTLGERPGDLTDHVEDLIHTLAGEKPGFTGIDAAATRLVELLAERDLLIVIDDVWNDVHLKPFLRGGPHCARLITTRNLDTLPENTKVIDVGAMQQDEAVALLGAGLPSGNEKELHALGARLGKWPLLLKLANGVLRHRVNNGEPLPKALDYANEAYSHGPEIFDKPNATECNQAVAKTMEVSLHLLSEFERARYYELAVFPDDTNIPLITLGKLWRKTRQLEEFDTDRLCGRLHQLSLMLSFDLATRHVRLHDVVREYLRQKQRENLSALHNHLLDIHRPASGASNSFTYPWTALPDDEPYLWDHLTYHLSGAGCKEELVATVKDLRYLAKKTYLRNAIAAENDLRTAEDLVKDDMTVRMLRRGFIQSGHILSRCNNLKDLEATLHSRLTHSTDLTPLTESLSNILQAPYLTSWHSMPDLPHPSLVRVLSGHLESVNSCAISSDRSFIVSASYDKTLKVWDTRMRGLENFSLGTERFTLRGHEDAVVHCAINSDDSLIVSASLDHTLKVWDVRSGKERFRLLGHKDGVSSCAICEKRHLIVSASYDKTLKIWDSQSGKKLKTFSGHQDKVLGCAISPDGSFIVSASSDHTLKIWDTESGRVRHTLRGHKDSVTSCAISPVGGFVVSASADHTLKIWDIESGRATQTLRGHTEWVRSCTVSPKSNIIVSTSSDKTLKVWDSESVHERFTLSGHTDKVRGCTISADGSWVVSASSDRTLKVWDVRRESQHPISSGHTHWVRGCAVSPDGSFAVSASDDETLIVWDAQNGCERRRLAGHQGWVRGCAISSDGLFIVSASDDKNLKIWDARSGDERYTFSGHLGEVRGCVISPDRSFMVSASFDKTLKVWDLNNGIARFTLSGHTDSVRGCAISPDGSFIVSASYDKTLKVWDTENGTLRFTLSGHQNWIKSCAISSDGSMVVSASDDKTLKVWDIQTGYLLHTLSGHIDWVKGCAFSPDNTLITSVSFDKSVKLWEARSGLCLATLHTDGPLFDCAWFPNGQHLIVVGNCGVYFLRLVL